MLGEDNDRLESGLPEFEVYRQGDAHLTVGGIKRWVDGALGSHGAWLLEPYTDLPTSVGLNIVTPDELRESARLAAANGLQLCSHAIGDRANRVTLDIYEETISSRPNGRELRWRASPRPRCVWVSLSEQTSKAGRPTTLSFFLALRSATTIGS